MYKLNEKMGVPDGLIELSDEIYELIIGQLKNDNLDVVDNHIKLKLNKYDINGMSVKLPISIEVLDNNVHKIDIPHIPFMVGASMSKGQKMKYKSGKVMLHNNEIESNSELTFRFLVDGNSNIPNSIFNFIKNNTHQIKSVISHELMHLYDNTLKNKKEDLMDHALYNSIQSIKLPFTEISNLFHYIYYLSSAEMSVRASEIYSSLKSKNVTKEDFLENMGLEKIIMTLNDIIKFSYSDMKKSLSEQQDGILEFFDEIDLEIDDDDNAINELLRITFINLSNATLENIEDKLSNYSTYSDMGSIFSIFRSGVNKKIESENINKQFNKYVRSFMKYKNNIDDYFENLIIKLTFDAKKLKKKLYKIYDMLDSSKNKSDYINDWNIHTKINQKVGENKIALDFNDFKKLK